MPSAAINGDHPMTDIANGVNADNGNEAVEPVDGCRDFSNTRIHVVRHGPFSV